jgi:hypothetical protein
VLAVVSHAEALNGAHHTESRKQDAAKSISDAQRRQHQHTQNARHQDSTRSSAQAVLTWSSLSLASSADSARDLPISAASWAQQREGSKSTDEDRILNLQRTWTAQLGEQSKQREVRGQARAQASRAAQRRAFTANIEAQTSTAEHRPKSGQKIQTLTSAIFASAVCLSCFSDRWLAAY